MKDALRQKSQPRTSLAVGFPGGEPPEKYARHVGRDHREIALCDEFPYEDAQFETVMIDGAAVGAKAVREAHRVLRPAGILVFTVPEKTGRQEGFTLPGVYKIVGEGFDILAAERQPWWTFGLRGRTLGILARKKNWRSRANEYRPYA